MSNSAVAQLMRGSPWAAEKISALGGGKAWRPVAGGRVGSDAAGARTPAGMARATKSILDKVLVVRVGTAKQGSAR